jgi:NACalpha-BTF3-like transcription factor
MDIGQGNFPILTQQQASPTIAGLANMIAMHLQRQQVQRNQATLPYAGPQAAANLQKQQLQNEWYAPEARAQIGEQNASAQNLTQQALGQKIVNAYLPQQQQADIGLKNSQSQYYGMGGPSMGVGVGTVLAVKRQVAKEHQDWSTEQVDDATSQYLRGANTFSDGSPLPPPSGQVAAFTDMSTMKTNTAKGIDTMNYASTLQDQFKAGDQVADDAFSYAGAGGAAKLVKDQAVAAAGGTPSPQYESYKKFTEQIIPGIAADIIRTEGASSTDGQKALAILQANPIGVKSNPQIAKQQWLQLKSLYDSIGATAATPITQKKGQLLAAPSANTNSQSSASASSNANLSEAKIAKVMKQYNMSRQEAIEALGGS